MLPFFTKNIFRSLLTLLNIPATVCSDPRPVTLSLQREACSLQSLVTSSDEIWEDKTLIIIRDYTKTQDEVKNTKCLEICNLSCIQFYFTVNLWRPLWHSDKVVTECQIQRRPEPESTGGHWENLETGDLETNIVPSSQLLSPDNCIICTIREQRT